MNVDFKALFDGEPVLDDKYENDPSKFWPKIKDIKKKFDETQKLLSGKYEQTPSTISRVIYEKDSICFTFK